ncbi:MAG: apolipoprotein N-acyltransferase [Treponema sp.]|nr:apolipoprotein N-acyltransferase [Treponema sp.]
MSKRFIRGRAEFPPSRAGGVVVNLAAILGAALLFAGAFPNPLFRDGFALFGWIALAPVFFVIRRTSLPASAAWGGLYGYVSYALFNYWLISFHPAAGFIAGFIFFVYLAALFPLLKLVQLAFPRRGFILMWLLWLGYEYLRSLGFLGYSYGILGYSQWRQLPLIQIASLCGVWGVSALVTFPSALLGQFFGDRVKNKSARSPSIKRVGRSTASASSLCGEGSNTPCPGTGVPEHGAFKPSFFRYGPPALIWLAALAAVLGYGFLSQDDFGAFPTARVALIQPNNDPWKGGTAEYRENLRSLIRLSGEALAAGAETDLVVWPETAFVPGIYWYLNYREGGNYPLVKELADYLAGESAPFVIGNDDGRKEVNAQGLWERVDYNAALVFEKGEISAVYRKMHLVPFAEYFPYEGGVLTLIRRALEEDTHFWKPGSEAVVFETARPGGRPVKFSTPICFEDTFGYLSRDFTRAGAELIVNISNDAWSGRLSCQIQHLSMAVFRSVENRRAMVRSTSTGQTCAIAPSGRVIAMAEPFTQSFLAVEVPLPDTLTPYTRWGDFLGRFFALAALAGITAACAVLILRRTQVQTRLASFQKKGYT